MKRTLSTTAVARLLGVAVGSVSNWIDQGKLKAGRTPGGHRRVAVPNLVAFLRRQKLPMPPELGGFTPTVLIVDDEPAVVHWLAQEIRDRHPEYEILEANDGFAAGELVGARRPDVVILDIRMPGMDGFEVCRRIKAREQTSEAVVIAITAEHSEKVEREALACGVSACLAKPVDPADIIARLEDALG